MVFLRTLYNLQNITLLLVSPKMDTYATSQVPGRSSHSFVILAMLFLLIVWSIPYALPRLLLQRREESLPSLHCYKGHFHPQGRAETFPQLVPVPCFPIPSSLHTVEDISGSSPLVQEHNLQPGTQLASLTLNTTSLTLNCCSLPLECDSASKFSSALL